MSAQPVVFESGHTDMIHDAQLDHYGRRLLTASSDHSIRVFEVTPDGQHTLSATLAGHDGPVWQVAWAHPRFGQVFASCGYDCRVVVWREQAPGIWGKVWEDETHSSSVNSIAFAPHTAGLILAAGSSDGFVSIWTHCQDQSWAHEVIAAHKGGVSAVSWAPTLKSSDAGSAAPVLRLVTGGCDNAVRIWTRSSADAQQQQQQQQQIGHEFGQVHQGGWSEVKSFAGGHQTHGDWVRDVAWAPSVAGGAAATVASCSEDKTVCIWTEGTDGTWSLSKTLSFAERPWRVSWSLIGDVLAVAQADNTVSLWHQGADGQWAQASSLGSVATPSGAAEGDAATPAAAAGAAAASPAAAH